MNGHWHLWVRKLSYGVFWST